MLRKKGKATQHNRKTNQHNTPPKAGIFQRKTALGGIRTHDCPLARRRYQLSYRGSLHVYITGHDEVREAVFKKKEVTRRFGNTIWLPCSLYGHLAVAFLLYLEQYYQGTKRDATVNRHTDSQCVCNVMFLYSFAVNEDSSSDEETVYIKTPAKVHVVYTWNTFSPYTCTCKCLL